MLLADQARPPDRRRPRRPEVELPRSLDAPARRLEHARQRFDPAGHAAHYTPPRRALTTRPKPTTGNGRPCIALVYTIMYTPNV